MAQSTTGGNDVQTPTDNAPGMAPRESHDFDVKADQLNHIKRILDLQIQSSRNIYADALRLLALNGLLLGGFILGGLILSTSGAMTAQVTGEITIVLAALGLVALFGSLIAATLAYLGETTNYGNVVSSDEPSEYRDKYLTRNYRIVQDNAEALEARMESIRNALALFVTGLSALVLGVGYLLLPLSLGAQIVVFVIFIILVGYLVNNVMGMKYLEGQTEKFVR